MRLPITIVAIDTDPDSQPLTRFAVKQTLRGLDVQDVVYFGAAPLGLGERFIETQRFDSIDTYSEFVLKCIWPFIATEYILIVHWDGFIANPANWRDEFLDYDYIGAPWAWANDDHKVGNGGFCIRSRKLLLACRDPKLQRRPDIPYGGIEDIVICRLYREALENIGIRFAPIELAQAFSYETGEVTCQPFGFHGPANMPIFVAEKYLIELAPSLKKKIRPGPVLDMFKQHCQMRGYTELLALMDSN
ncbi:MAG: hypothetical protein HY849_07120 [Nitrosomonadales bacterium]|nr:hypothetical protein [Nitrosomonadales bacterium]